MPSLSVRAGVISHATTGGVVTPALPAGWQAGDRFIAFVFGRAAAMTVLSAPADWSLVTSYTVNGSIYVYAKDAEAGDSDPSWDLSSTPYTSAVVHAVYGDLWPDIATMLHAQGETSNAATTGMPLADISPTENDTFILAVARKDKTGSSAVSALASGTYTEITEALPGGVAAQNIWIGYEQQTTATARTSQTVTQTGTTESIKANAITLALRTQPADGTVPDITSATDPMTDGSAFTISGNFSASGNTLFIGGVSHAIGTQNATTITGTLSLGDRRYGLNDVVVRNSSGLDSPATGVQVLPTAAYEYIDITALYPANNRIETTAADLAPGDQVRITNPINTTLADVALDASGGLELKPTDAGLAASIDAQVNDGTGWGSAGTLTFNTTTPGAANTTFPRAQRRSRIRRFLNAGR